MTGNSNHAADASVAFVSRLCWTPSARLAAADPPDRPRPRRRTAPAAALRCHRSPPRRQRRPARQDPSLCCDGHRRQVSPADILHSRCFPIFCNSQFAFSPLLRSFVRFALFYLVVGAQGRSSGNNVRIEQRLVRRCIQAAALLATGLLPMNSRAPARRLPWVQAPRAGGHERSGVPRAALRGRQTRTPTATPAEPRRAAALAAQGRP